MSIDNNGNIMFDVAPITPEKYYCERKEISKAAAEEIESKNKHYWSLAEQGDLEALLKIKTIIKL
jgi:hypothetical protein